MTPAPPAPVAPQKSGPSALVIVLLVLGVGCLPITGILAAIAIPNFIRFQARSKMAECKTALKSIYISEKSAYGDDKKYLTRFTQLGLPPLGPTQRYTYYLSSEEVLPATARGAPSQQVGLAQLRAHGVTPAATEAGFTAACVGNIDNDDGVDIWSISSEDRTGKDGEPIPAGTPYHDLDDLTEP